MGTIFSDEDLAVAAHDVRDFGAKGDGKTNALLKEFADRDGKIVWIDFNDSLVDEQGWVPESIMADEIHPTDVGYDIWMKNLSPHIP